MRLRAIHAAAVAAFLSACGGGSSSDSKTAPDTSGTPSAPTPTDDGRHLSCDGYPKTDPLNGTTICEERDFNGIANTGSVDINTDSGEILARGGARSTIDLKALVFVKALTEARAKAIAQQVVIHTDNDHFYATGPDGNLLPPPLNLNLGLEHWWVSFETALPQSLSLSANTISGAIAASNLAGDLSFSTQSDAIDIANLSGSVSIDTISGNVTADLDGPAEMTVTTQSGGILFRAPANYSATFEFQTQSGSIHSDFGGQPQSSVGGDKSLTENTNGGGPTISATTISGDIDLQKK